MGFLAARAGAMEAARHAEEVALARVITAAKEGVTQRLKATQHFPVSINHRTFIETTGKRNFFF